MADDVNIKTLGSILNQAGLKPWTRKGTLLSLSRAQITSARTFPIFPDVFPPGIRKLR